MIFKLVLTTLILTVSTWTSTAIAQTARIESTTGMVKLKRQNWSEFKPVSVNTEVKSGDQIFPAQGAKVTVLCPDLQKRPVNSGVPSGLKTICPVWPALKAKNPPPPGSLGGINTLIPYLISPRHSLILTDTPVISWNAVPKTQQYTVRVTDSQGIIWEQQTEKSSILYSGQPALVPGTPYSIKIQGDRGQSSEQDNSSKLEFVKLHPTEIQTIKAEVSKIEQLNLNAQTTALTLANLYGTYTLPASMGKNYSLSASTRPTYHLTSDAIAILEAVIQQDQTSPLIERTLGDLYSQTGLANLATEHYLKTIKLAQTPETLEDLTLAQFGLGEISSATDHSADAKLWYSKARDGYLSLGDSQQADFLQRLIESL